MPLVLKERCILDGGDLEAENRGGIAYKVCTICGMEERLEGVSMEELVNHDRQLEHDRQQTADLRDDAFDGPKGHGPSARRPKVEAADWKLVAKEQLGVLLDEIADMESKKTKAREIHLALTACGIILDPLPFDDDLVELEM